MVSLKWGIHGIHQVTMILKWSNLDDLGYPYFGIPNEPRSLPLRLAASRSLSRSFTCFVASRSLSRNLRRGDLEKNTAQMAQMGIFRLVNRLYPTYSIHNWEYIPVCIFFPPKYNWRTRVRFPLTNWHETPRAFGEYIPSNQHIEETVGNTGEICSN